MTHVRLTKAYSGLLSELGRADRYTTRSVAEHYLDTNREADPNAVTVVLRVDVDNALHLAPALAKAMAANGLRGSFYFLTDPERHYRIFDSGIPSEVATQGFEVGLHYDHLFAELDGGPPALDALAKDVKRLSDETGTPIRGAVFHGHAAMDALGRSNRELLLNVQPEDIGLDYHDGLFGGYNAPEAPGWKPPCDRALGDYFGYPGSWGFNYDPGYAVRELRRAKPGDVVHLGLHAMNAFRFWEHPDATYGETLPPREPLAAFLRKAASIRIRHRLLRGHSFTYAVQLAAFSATCFFLAKILGAFWPRSGQREYFDSYDSERERIFGLGIGFWRSQLEEYGMTAPGGRVLEVGSGNGQWLIASARDAASCTGIEPGKDIRAFCLDKLKEYPYEAEKITILDGRAEFLPFPDDSFDRVICSGVFMFTDQPRAFAEMARVLAPGGRVYIMANGLGYFLQWCLDGLRKKDTVKMQYGLGGLIATTLKWRGGSSLDRPKAVGPSEMLSLCEANGLVLQDVRLYMHQDIYPKEILGIPTNYVFLAEKPQN